MSESGSSEKVRFSVSETLTGRVIMFVVVEPCFSGENATLSGMGEVVRMSARACKDAGATVIIASPKIGSLRDALSPFCDNFVDVHDSSDRQMFGRNIWTLLRAARAFGVDTVHFHVPHFRWGLESVAFMRLSPARVLRTEHNPMMVRPGLFWRQLLRISDGAVDQIVYVSEGNRRRFEEFLPWRVGGTVVHNAIDPERLIRSKGGDAPSLGDRFSYPTAAFVATRWQIEYGEGRRPLAPVLAALARLDDNWKLVVVGSGDIFRAQQVVSEMALSARVSFVGPVLSASAILARCALLVSSSHYEGLSVTFLESWYHQVPVLCTQVDGVEDVVGPDDMRAITVPHNNVDALAIAWTEVLNPCSEFVRVSQLAMSAVRDKFLRGHFDANIVSVYRTTQASKT